jgi:UDP-N-acetylmuramate--alanine ligase
MTRQAVGRGSPARRRLVPGVPERVHLVGAGGAGMSGAARILVERGHRVSGSDRAESEHTPLLRALEVPLAVGPRAPRLADEIEMVVRSAAVPDADPTVAEARERGLAVLKYSELLGRLTPAGRTLAVAGTHGKTTGTWMLWHALAGLAAEEHPRPGMLVGGVSRALGTNAGAGDPDGWFAVEACEYDRSFLQLAPQGATISNVEADHLDYYGDLDAIKNAFARFADRVHPDGLIVCGRDVPRRVEEAARSPVWRLGRELEVDLLAEREGRFAFRLRGPGWSSPRLDLAVPGAFNVDNASLALALAVGLAAPALSLGTEEAAARAARGIAEYTGCRRRFEPWGAEGGIEVIHDYAHHPTEVRVVLEAARRALPKKSLHVLFQPHQHSRTARFLSEFVESLCFADRVVVADVYGARTHVDGEHTAGAADLADRLVKAGVRAVAPGPLAASIECFVDGLTDSAAALVLGAGDVGMIRDELFRRLALRSAG